MSKKTSPEIATAREVARLRKEIEALTGRVPVSSDPRYLAQRLGDIRKRAAAGQDVRHRPGAPQSVMSISMPSAAREAVNAILEREQLGQSELARKAFALWAASNGYKAEAKVIGG